MTENLPALDINKIEKKMLQYKQVDCPVVHHFSPGIYMREVKIPAGTFAIGHRQKTEHLNIFLRGRVMMLGEDGSTKELIAPMIFTGQPGRKMGYISEDVVWLNVYTTKETDVDTLENMFLDKSDSWKTALLDKLPKLIDQEDYKKVIAESGFAPETVKKQVENEEDQIPFPPGSYSVGVFPSNIDRLGLFATAAFEPGEVIAPARIKGKRTPAGRYTNHSKRPNSIMKMVDGQIILVALKDIKGCKGGMLGEEITVNYRDSLKLVKEEIKCQE